jgi:NADH-quinone oxidoreductase subunit G
MPTLTIDGNEITVEQGTTIIQAADMLGIEIPRYCYHPGLSIVGQCRICLVEVERAPKPQVACYTVVTDGMVVHTNSEMAREARKAVLEFLLVNHPLDCPVCDQAGECWLQNYYMLHGQHQSRMYEDKVKKHKALVIGPHVVLDSERCILCSRCVRFCDEVTETHELGIFNRGDHSELLPYPGRELDNKYSGCTVDICPVGALTDRDFRFRTRVWYLREVKSICPGCATGCNIYVHYNARKPYKADGVRVPRLKPRFHPEVNQWWMCDEGRYGFTYVDGKDRITAPLMLRAGELEETSWDVALLEVCDQIESTRKAEGADKIGVLLSPKMTNEGLFAARRLFIEHLGLTKVAYRLDPKEPGYEDGFLMKADKNPNSRGAQEILACTMTASDLLAEAKAGNLKLLIVFYHDLADGFEAEEIDKALEKVETLIFQGITLNDTARRAQVVLPAAAFVEIDGTYTNFAGRVQRINKAVEPLGEARPDWYILRKLARMLGKTLVYFQPEDVFLDLAATVQAFSGLRYDLLGDEGATLNGGGAETNSKQAKVA